jgi:SsrA-binding protein
MAPAENAPIKIVAENRKARHDYLILEQFEAGMVLTGTEVQSMRLGKVNLKDAYAKIKNGEIFLYQVHIGPYPFAYYNNHEPLRTRKLLLHRREINRLFAKANEQGHTLVPLRIYFKKGKAKVVIAIAKGKRAYDKRESIRKREHDREMDRARKRA